MTVWEEVSQQLTGKSIVVVPWPHPVTGELIRRLMQGAPKTGGAICLAEWTEEHHPVEVDIGCQIGIKQAEYRFSRVLGTHADVVMIYGRKDFLYQLRDKMRAWADEFQIPCKVADVEGQGFNVGNDSNPARDN